MQRPVISGIIAALEKSRGYRIYNLGNASPVSLQELIDSLETALDRKAIIRRLPPQPGDVERTFADIQAARTDLGYEPATPFAAGLAQFVTWLRQQEA